MKRRIVIIDNQDSFTYNLVDYFRQLKSDVVVLDNTTSIKVIDRYDPEILVLSPGPGNPRQAGNLIKFIKHYSNSIPMFGVCLGLQAMIEAFGGKLKILPKPIHGKSSQIKHDGKTIFSGIPNPFLAGRYHSIAADIVPEEFEISASTEGTSVVMAVRHKTLAIEAVQFHPESVLTMQKNIGLQIIRNVLHCL